MLCKLFMRRLVWMRGHPCRFHRPRCVRIFSCMLNVDRPLRVVWMCRCVVCFHLSWFFVEWEWGVVGDGVPDGVFCESYGSHVGFVVVKCGAKVGVVPLDVFGCSTDVLGVVEGPLQFFCHAAELESALCVVFPYGGPQHRCFGVCVKSSGFHRRVEVFKMVEFLHATPNPRARGQFGLGFISGSEGLLGGMRELCHKKECREYKDVVNTNGQMQSNLAPRPLRELLIVPFNRGFP